MEKRDPKNKKPAMIRTLCVLSFIGIILFIARDIASYFYYKAMGALNENSFLTGIAINLFVFIGVFFMWKLKKIGFYIYALFQIMWIALPILMEELYHAYWIDTYFELLILPVLLSTIIFIILYAVNLKHMVN